VAIGQTGVVQVATVEDVRSRLRWLARKRREAVQDEVIDIDARLDMAKDREEKERAEKREKRNQKRRKQKDPLELAEARLKLEGDIE
jgi:U4/U6.U5 tri-snRNP component SNU23